MPSASSYFRFGPFRLNPADRQLLRQGQQVRLAPKLFDTLLFLVENAGHLVKKETLIRAVWKDTFVEEGSLAHSVSVLRKILGPNSNGNAFIETIPRHGYRFIAPVESGKTNLAASAAAEEETPTPPALHSLAVLPLVNLSRSRGQDYFADGMTEALIGGLARSLPLRVISRTSVMRYRQARKPLPQIGEELNVDGIVEGTVFRSGKRVRITVQLLHAPSDRHLWATSYERDLRDVLTLQNKLAEAISREIGQLLDQPPRKKLNLAGPHHPAAHDAYLKGLFCWNQRTDAGLRKSIEFYAQAISKDPKYALAFAGLADSYALMGSRRLAGIDPREAMAKAKEAAGKALHLDQTLAEAHASLAFVSFQFDWNWRRAEMEFRRAIDLNPNAAITHYRYAMYLAIMSRMDEATREIAHAQQLDPLSPIICTARGRLLHFQRNYDAAIEYHRRALAIDPHFVEAHFNLGMIYEQKSMFREAISQFRKVIRMVGKTSSYWSAGLAHAYGLAGMKKQALQILHQLQSSASSKRSVSPFDIAWVYLGLGEKDAALIWMEKAFQGRCSPLIYSNVEPALDPLRPDPRFQHLLHRLDLTR